VNKNSDVLSQHHAPLGMKKLSSADYEPMLEAILLKLNVKTEIPVLICGMAGAAQGWQEAKYRNVPSQLNDISEHAIKVKTKSRDVRILPGLCQRVKTNPDVMRGEETLLLGASSKGCDFETYCMPGTHSKWVWLGEGEIQSFQTFMTGELYALLSEHSTLATFMNNNESSLHEYPAFINAVDAIHQNSASLTSLLFSLRSGALLFSSEDLTANAASLSGLCIGAEFTSIEFDKLNNVGLIAQGNLASAYSKVMDHLGINFELIDSHDLALEGLNFCAKKIWPN